MINDTIDILDAKIINFSIDFEVIGSSDLTKQQVLNNCAIAISNKFSNKLDIGEHLSITDVYTLLNKVNGVSVLGLHNRRVAEQKLFLTP
jgi:hypothetical protein